MSEDRPAQIFGALVVLVILFWVDGYVQIKKNKEVKVEEKTPSIEDVVKAWPVVTSTIPARNWYVTFAVTRQGQPGLFASMVITEKNTGLPDMIEMERFIEDRLKGIGMSSATDRVVILNTELTAEPKQGYVFGTPAPIIAPSTTNP